MLYSKYEELHYISFTWLFRTWGMDITSLFLFRES